MPFGMHVSAIRYTKSGQVYVASKNENARSLVLQAEVNKLQAQVASISDTVEKDLTGGRELLTPEQIKSLTDKLAKQAEDAIKKGAVADVLEHCETYFRRKCGLTVPILYRGE